MFSVFVSQLCVEMRKREKNKAAAIVVDYLGKLSLL